MRFSPMFDRLLIKEDLPETKFGNIIIPDTVEGRRKFTGTVIAVGPGYTYADQSRDKVVVAMQSKPGDRVMYGEYTGFDLEIDGENYKVVQEREIYGRFIEDGSDKVVF